MMDDKILAMLGMIATQTAMNTLLLAKTAGLDEDEEKAIQYQVGATLETVKDLLP